MTDKDRRRRWRARLKGELHDLQDLVELFTFSDLRVVQEEADFFLESASFDGLGASVDVYEEARRIMPLLDGAAKLKRQGFQDVEVDGLVVEFPAGSGGTKALVPGGSITPRGRVTHVVVQPATLDLRARVPEPAIVVEGQEPTPPAPGTLETDRWLELAGRDPDVADALATFGGRPHDWVNLYKVYEIVRRRADVVGSEWASQSEVRRFTRTANHQDAGGADARHARSKAEPPRHPMTPEHSVELIRRILTRWLGSLVADA